MLNGNSKASKLFFEIVSFFKLFTVKGFYAEGDELDKGVGDEGNRPDTYVPDDKDAKSTREEWGSANADDDGEIARIKGGKKDDDLSAEEREDLEEYQNLIKEGKSEEEIEDIKAKRKEKKEDPPADKQDKKEDEPAGDDDGETVKLGKEEIPMSVYEELVKKAKVHYGDGFDKLDEPMMEKILLDRYNFDKGSKALNERNRTGEFTKKSLADLTKQLEETRETIKAEKQAFEDELKAVKDQIEENKKILASQPKDEFDADEVLDLKIAKKTAENENKLLEKYVKTQEDELQKTIERERAENDNLVNSINIQKLQDTYPELRTKSPIAKLWNEYNDTDGVGMDEIELAKMLRIKAVLEEFYGKKSGTIENHYKIMRLNLPILPDEKPAGDKGKREPKSVKEALKELEKKQNSNKGNMGGGGGGDRSALKKTGEARDDQQYREDTGWEVPI